MPVSFMSYPLNRIETAIVPVRRVLYFIPFNICIIPLMEYIETYGVIFIHQRTMQLSEGAIRFIGRVIMKKMIRKIRI